VEPAEAMRDEHVSVGVHADVAIAGAIAEHLPLREASIDVAWLSTVVHHLTDLDACARELARVLTGHGVVLVRGLFSDLGLLAGLDRFPGWQQARSWFPSTAAVMAPFARSGFDIVEISEVEDVGPLTVGDVIVRVQRLRGIDSLLVQFTDVQLDRGIAALSQRDPGELLGSTRLGLVALKQHRRA
jgi:SAM-dependent methyltransferase